MARHLRDFHATTETNGKVLLSQLDKERYIVVEGGHQARLLPRYKRRRRSQTQQRPKAPRNVAAPASKSPETVASAAAYPAPENGSQVEDEEQEEEMKPLLINVAEKELDSQPSTVSFDDTRDNRTSSAEQFAVEFRSSVDEHPREVELTESIETGAGVGVGDGKVVVKPPDPMENAQFASTSSTRLLIEKPDSPWRPPPPPPLAKPATPTGEADPDSGNPCHAEGRERRERCFNCCRHFVAFLFSTVGSCCLLVAYTVLGGFVFQYLESQNEMNMKEDMDVTRWRYVAMLWNITENLNVLYELNWTSEANAILESFTNHVFQATKKKGWDGGKDGDMELQWSFPGALLYSITVVTTIGYGHIAPKTDWGKVVTIFYAIFGIPLTLFTITNLGSIMATAFRFLYHYIVCCVSCVVCLVGSRRRHRRRCRRQRRSRWRENQEQERSQQQQLQQQHECETMMTTTTTTMMMTTLNFDLDDWRGLTGEEERGEGRDGGQGRGKEAPETRECFEGGDEVEPSLREVLRKTFHGPEEVGKVRVPIYVCLLLMLGYLALGTLVFQLSEEWDPLICLYFCFITLSTIGFGDYVPGTLDKLGSEEKMVLCALYLVFGLAVIAMCFDLIQEEAKNKLRRVGQRLGLLRKNDP